MKVFITGGTTGIGAELAKLYVSRGYKVAVCGRNQSKFLETFSKYEQSALKFYEVDVTNGADLKKSIDEFVGNGTLDLIIANAGVAMNKKSSIPDFNDAKRIFDINVNGVLNTFEHALPHLMKAKKGHLVAIASVAGMVGLPGTAAYCGSKAAVLKICESFAIDLKDKGIAVTAIAPGFIDTPLTRVNKHPMPFLMPAPKAARLIARAIQRKKILYTFPFRMNLLINILALLPRSIYATILRLPPFRFSE